MPAAKPALLQEPGVTTPLTNVPAPGPRRIDNRSVRQFQRRETSFQPRIPAIIGEATYRGLMPVDGIINGQLGATGSTLIIKQRPKNAIPDDYPELNGEITFKDISPARSFRLPAL